MTDNPSPKNQMQGLADAIAERIRQIEAEGWDTRHDDAHDRGEMAWAAAAYALGTPDLTGPARSGVITVGWRKVLWPWDMKWWKPTDRRRDLIKAAALIIAEIERLDRAALAAAEADHG